MKGINVRPGASVEDMQVALEAKFEEENLSVREVFDRYVIHSAAHRIAHRISFLFEHRVQTRFAEFTKPG